MTQTQHRAGATATGVGIQTLHYYEREGLIERPGRTSAGYRVYSERTLRRVRGIKRAQGLGFTLHEISELIGVAESGENIEEIARLARGKLAEIDAKVAQLAEVRAALEQTLECCSCGGDLSRCDVIDGLGALPDANPRESLRRTSAGRRDDGRPGRELQPD